MLHLATTNARFSPSTEAKCGHTHIHTLPGGRRGTAYQFESESLIASGTCAVHDRCEAYARAIRDEDLAFEEADELGHRAAPQHVLDRSALRGTLERERDAEP